MTLFQVFRGRSHPLLVKPNTIEPSVTTRFLRINPVQWYGKPCLRVEMYRCSLRNGKKKKDEFQCLNMDSNKYSPQSRKKAVDF